MTGEAATPEELRRARRVEEMRAKLGNPQGWYTPPAPASQQVLQPATSPLDLLTEQHMRGIIDEYRRTDRRQGTLMARDAAIEQLQMIAAREQAVIRAYGKRIAMNVEFQRFISPHSFEVHAENMKWCNKLRDAERPRYNCRDCRRETYEEFRLCHLYSLAESHPETRRFLKR